MPVPFMYVYSRKPSDPRNMLQVHLLIIRVCYNSREFNVLLVHQGHNIRGGAHGRVSVTHNECRRLYTCSFPVVGPVSTVDSACGLPTIIDHSGGKITTHALLRVVPIGCSQRKGLDHGSNSMPWSGPSTNSRLKYYGCTHNQWVPSGTTAVAAVGHLLC